MKKRTTTEIIIEQEEIFVVHVHPQKVSAWCEACGMEVLMMTPELAAAVSGASVLNTFRLVEAGQVHFRETRQGALLICSRSLAAA